MRKVNELKVKFKKMNSFILMKNRETETMEGRQLGLRSSPSCLFVYALLSISVREHGLWPRLRLNSFIGADLVEDS